MTSPEHCSSQTKALELETFSNTLRSNRMGILCLQTNESERALEHFAMAFSRHEIAKSKLFARMEITVNGWILSNENGNNSQNIENIIGRKMGTWFTPCPLPMQQRSIDRNAMGAGPVGEDFLHFEPIQLPMLVTETLSDMLAAYEKGDRGCCKELLDTMILLSICHAYNLGITYHLCGHRILSSIKEERSIQVDFSASTQMIPPNAKILFDRAGQMYEYILQLEYSGFMDSDPHHHRSGYQGHLQTDSNVPRLIIVLACTNNLADLYHTSGHVLSSRGCYRQLKATTKRLAGFLRPGGHCRDTILLCSYLPIFWERSRMGLARRRSNSSAISEEMERGDEDSVNNLPLMSLVQKLFGFIGTSAAAA